MKTVGRIALLGGRVVVGLIGLCCLSLAKDEAMDIVMPYVNGDKFKKPTTDVKEIKEVEVKVEE